jgi:hypothetical protein
MKAKNLDGNKYSERMIIAAALLTVILILAVFVRYFPQPLTAASSAFGTVSLTIDSICSFDLLTNWNFISLCAEPANRTVDSVMQSVAGEYDYILEWNATSQAYDLYSIYATSKPFTELEQNSSYFIHMTDTHTGFTVTGNTTENMNISMVNKWNSPSWPYEFSKAVSAYLATVNGSWEYLLKWNATSQSYSLYSAYASSHPFTQIFKGEGQFIYVNTTSAILQYNRTALSS